MDKKNALPFWISIPAVLLLVGGFRVAFGPENALIGLVFFTGLVIISRFDTVDIEPLRGGLAIVGVVFFIVSASFLSAINPYIGLLVNCAVLFCLVYVLFGTFQNHLYAPAVIGYLYLLASPETWDKGPERYLAAGCGALILVVALLAIQRHQRQHTVKAKFQLLVAQVAAMGREVAGVGPGPHQPAVTLGDPDGSSTTLDAIRKTVHLLFSGIYQRQRFHKSQRVLDEMRISFTLALERLAVIFQRMEDEKTELTPHEQRALHNLARLLEKVRLHISDFESFGRVSTHIDHWVDKYRTIEPLSPEMYEVIETCALAAQQLRIIGQAGQNPHRDELTVEDAQWTREIKHALKPERLRVIFALKLAISVGGLMFISQVLGLEYGRWMAYTVAFLLRPYSEETSTRSLNRLKGTLVACGLFLVIFEFIDSYWLLTSFVMLADIIFSRSKSAGPIQTGCGTFAALASLSLLTESTTTTLGAERVIYVLIGMGIAFFISRYVFPYHIVSDTSRLTVQYRATTYELIDIFIFSRLREHTPELLKDHTLADVGRHRSLNVIFKGLILSAQLIEQQLAMNNRHLRAEELTRFVVTQHQLINDLYFLFATVPVSLARKPGFVHLLHRLEETVALYRSVTRACGCGPGMHGHTGVKRAPIRGEVITDDTARLSSLALREGAEVAKGAEVAEGAESKTAPHDEEPPTFYENYNLEDAIAGFLDDVNAAFAFCDERNEKMVLTTMMSVAEGLQSQIGFDLCPRALRR